MHATNPDPRTCNLQMRSWSSSREVSRRLREPKMEETDHVVGEAVESLGWAEERGGAGATPFGSVRGCPAVRTNS